MNELRSDQYKEFVYKSSSKKNNLEKFYILSLRDKVKDEPPYVLRVKGGVYSIFNEEVIVPDLQKNLAIFNTETNKIIYENSSLSYVSEYIEDLYKIDKIIISLRNDINQLEFYMLNNIFKVIDTFRSYLIEYKESSKYVGSSKIKEIVENIEEKINQFENSIFNRASYIDMKSSRLLTILSLMTLLPIAMFTWLSSSVPEDAMLIRQSRYTYWFVLLITIITVCITTFYYYKDLYY
jgi:hypothetical protein